MDMDWWKAWWLFIRSVARLNIQNTNLHNTCFCKDFFKQNFSISNSLEKLSCSNCWIVFFSSNNLKFLNKADINTIFDINMWSPCCEHTPQSPAISRCLLVCPYAPFSGSAGSACYAKQMLQRCFPVCPLLSQPMMPQTQWNLKTEMAAQVKTQKTFIFIGEGEGSNTIPITQKGFLAKRSRPCHPL